MLISLALALASYVEYLFNSVCVSLSFASKGSYTHFSGSQLQVHTDILTIQLTFEVSSFYDFA